MNNLDQIRAEGALAAADATSKQAVSKLPAIIISNGLLAAAAFADERKKDGTAPKRMEMQSAMNAVASHLRKPVHGIGVLANASSAGAMLKALSQAPATSLDLQRATAEALAFLAYLKRFATAEADGD